MMSPAGPTNPSASNWMPPETLLFNPHPVVVVAPVVAVPFAATVTSWPLLDEIVPVV